MLFLQLRLVFFRFQPGLFPLHVHQPVVLLLGLLISLYPQRFNIHLLLRDSFDFLLFLFRLDQELATLFFALG